MKNVRLLILFLVSVLFGCINSTAQDTIVMKNGLIVLGKIISIGADTVFLLQENQNESINLPIVDTRRVVFGYTIETQSELPVADIQKNEPTEWDPIDRPYKNMLRSSYMALILSQFVVEYERAQPDTIIDMTFGATVGFIVHRDGSDLNTSGFNSDVYGGYIRGSLRWYPHINKYRNNKLINQSMMGWYYGLMASASTFQFRTIYSQYYYDDYYGGYLQYSSTYVHAYRLSLDFLIGLQTPMSKRLVCNLFGGVGAGRTFISTSDGSDISIQAYQFTDFQLSYMSFTGGFSIGFRF